MLAHAISRLFIMPICRLAAALLLLSAACATPHKRDMTVCPEYRDQRCFAGTDCSMDATRGCRVCHCKRVEGVPVY